MARLNLPYRQKRLFSAGSFPGVVPYLDDGPTRLNLYGTTLTKKDIRILSFVTNGDLAYLNLGNTGLDLEEITEIIEKLNPEGLTFLNLSNNWLGEDSTTEDYVSLFERLPNLKSVNVNANGLGDHGLKVLLAAVRRFPQITCLKISDNDIHSQGARLLMSTLQSANHITELECHANRISLSNQNKIDKCLAYNRAVSRFFKNLTRASKQSEIKEALQLHPKLLTTRNLEGLLPIAVAVKHHNLAAAKILLNTGSPLTSVDAADSTLLDFAKRHTSVAFTHKLKYQLKIDLLGAVKTGDLPRVKTLSELLDYEVFITRIRKQTLLHIAAIDEQTQLLPYLLERYPVVFVKDADGKIPYDYVDFTKQPDLLNRFESVAIASIEACLAADKLKDLKAYLSTSLGARLLEHHQLTLMTLVHRMPNNACALHLESVLQQHHVTYDTATLDAVFSAKVANKSTRIPGDDIHKLLAHEVAQWRAQRPVKQPPDTHNLAKLRLSFVVTNAAHHPGGDHGRQSIPIDLNFDPNAIYHVEDFHDFQHHKHDGQKYLRSQTFFKQVKKNMPLADHASLDELYEHPNPKNKLVREFHHSERALFAYLSQPDIIQKICEALLSELELTSENNDFKISGIVFDLHTLRELCPRCEPSIPHWFGPQSELVTQFKKALSSLGFKLPNKHTGLASLIRVSSSVSLGASAPQALAAPKITHKVNMNRPGKAQGAILLKHKLTGGSKPRSTTFSNFSGKKRAASLAAPSSGSENKTAETPKTGLRR